MDVCVSLPSDIVDLVGIEYIQEEATHLKTSIIEEAKRLKQKRLLEAIASSQAVTANLKEELKKLNLTDLADLI